MECTSGMHKQPHQRSCVSVWYTYTFMYNVCFLFIDSLYIHKPYTIDYRPYPLAIFSMTNRVSYRPLYIYACIYLWFEILWLGGSFDNDWTSTKIP